MTVNNMDAIACSEEEHSPPLSENAGSSWLHWENEISSISGLNIDSTSELNGLVEDKQVAARAVALVVNSTRKGIVPLCADIASLLRAKRSLEKKVYLLKRDLEALRSSTSVSFRTSHSTSPTMPLADKMAMDRSRPCSRCSQCSVTGGGQHNLSTTSTSNNMNNTTTTTTTSTTKNHLSSPSVSRPASTRASPRLNRTQSSKTPASTNGSHALPNPTTTPTTTTTSDTTDSTIPASVIDVEETTPSASSTSSSTTGHRSNNHEGDTKCHHHDPHARHHDSDRVKRKNSLPEMTSEPSTEIQRVSPKISKEIQCNMPVLGDSPIEEQFLETVRLNSKLSEELGSARKEIEFLKGRLKELEMKQLARECSTHERYRFESKESSEMCLTSDPLSQTLMMNVSCRHNVNNRHRRPKSNGVLSSHRVSAPPGSLLYAEPLYGCKCNACEEAMGSDIHSALSAALNEELKKFPISSNVLVQLGDHVVTKGEKTGRIRYIGHLDKIGQPNMVFVGLELDAPVGHHDGFFNNKRYFFCQKDHGIFVPLHDMVCKVGAKNDNQTCIVDLETDRMPKGDDGVLSGMDAIMDDATPQPRPLITSGMIDHRHSDNGGGGGLNELSSTELSSMNHHCISTNNGSSSRNSIEDCV